MRVNPWQFAAIWCPITGFIGAIVFACYLSYVMGRESSQRRTATEWCAGLALLWCVLLVLSEPVLVWQTMIWDLKNRTGR